MQWLGAKSLQGRQDRTLALAELLADYFGVVSLVHKEYSQDDDRFHRELLPIANMVFGRRAERLPKDILD